MSWRDFVASLVGSVAWPATVALCVALFRHQIRALLEGPIKRWKVGPVEFENEWGRARERVGENVPTREALAHGDDELADLLALAEQAPVPAIQAAFETVESFVREIGAAAGLPGADKASVAQLAATLGDLELIDPKTRDALEGLVTLRNLAVHGPPSEPRRASEYIVLTETVLYALSRTRGGRAARGDTDHASAAPA